MKVRVLHTTTQTWNTIASICEAIECDETMELNIVLGGMQTDECDEQVSQYGYTSIRWEEYDPSSDRPDVLLLSQPYDQITILPDIRNYVGCVIVAETLLIRNTQSLQEFYNVHHRGFDRFEPDYYICDNLLYEDIKESFCLKGQLVNMGNAKYDGIYRAIHRDNSCRGYEKLKDKKIFLWASDHGIYAEFAMHTTFDIFAGTILSYAHSHGDIGLIVRPHHELQKELVRVGIWTSDDIEKFKRLCNSMDNVVFDENETYDEAYSCADAIITDMCCGVTVSALPTLKPICVLMRSEFEMPLHPELTDFYYKASSDEELISFMEMVRDREDSMYEEREKLASKYVKHFDGKNGYRIKEFIKEKYMEKMCNL